MKLPNAHSGVSKLFIAEILKIIGVLLLIISALNFVAAANTAVDAVASMNLTQTQGEAVGSFAMGGLLSLLGAALIPIIALVLTLVGLKQASKDEPDRMGKAFAFSIATLIIQVCTVVAAALNWGGFGNFLSDVAMITELLATVFMIMGVSEVTQMISRQDIADMGPKVMVISIIAIAAALIAAIIGHFVGGLFAVASLALTLLAYIVFVVFLGRASGALKKA